MFIKKVSLKLRLMHSKTMQWISYCCFKWKVCFPTSFVKKRHLSVIFLIFLGLFASWICKAFSVLLEIFSVENSVTFKSSLHAKFHWSKKGFRNSKERRNRQVLKIPVIVPFPGTDFIATKKGSRQQLTKSVGDRNHVSRGEI